MTFNIDTLIRDVRGRIGEIADEVARMIESMLPEIGAGIIRGAPLDQLGGGMPTVGETTSRLMPCGLYAVEVTVPEDFLRLVSVKISGWQRSANTLILPGDAAWECRWSAEPGIAGSPARPRAYLGPEGGVNILRLIGSESVDAALEHLMVLTIPKAPEFHFPSQLYPELVGRIAEKMAE